MQKLFIKKKKIEKKRVEKKMEKQWVLRCSLEQKEERAIR
jgi:hypothetical protein